MKALSQGDREVLRLLSEGVSDFEICRSLKLSQAALGKALKRIEARAIVESDDAGRFYERSLRIRWENKHQSLEGRFHALMEILPQAVIVADGRTGTIKEANAVAEQLFGFAPGRLVGMSVEELVPDEHRVIHGAYRIGFLSSIRKREMGYHPPIYGVRADGTQVEVAIALTASTVDDDVMVVCTERSAWQGGEERATEALSE